MRVVTTDLFSQKCPSVGLQHILVMFPASTWYDIHDIDSRAGEKNKGTRKKDPHKTFSHESNKKDSTIHLYLSTSILIITTSIRSFTKTPTL